MPVVQGIVAPDGTVVRANGNFRILSKQPGTLRVEVTGQAVSNAFVLGTAWRSDADIGQSAVSASPDPGAPNVMVFAVDDYYGVSFRIET